MSIQVNLCSFCSGPVTTLVLLERMELDITRAFRVVICDQRRCLNRARRNRYTKRIVPVEKPRNGTD